jgi:hypothetical protein
VFFEVKWDLRWFLRPWKHMFAARIRVWISSLMSLLQLMRVLAARLILTYIYFDWRINVAPYNKNLMIDFDSTDSATQVSECGCERTTAGDTWYDICINLPHLSRKTLDNHKNRLSVTELNVVFNLVFSCQFWQLYMVEHYKIALRVFLVCLPHTSFFFF